MPKVGETVKLVCPIPCDDLDVADSGEVLHVFPGGLAFMVRFPGGRIAVVTWIEVTPH